MKEDPWLTKAVVDGRAAANRIQDCAPPTTTRSAAETLRAAHAPLPPSGTPWSFRSRRRSPPGFREVPERWSAVDRGAAPTQAAATGDGRVNPAATSSARFLDSSSVRDLTVAQITIFLLFLEAVQIYFNLNFSIIALYLFNLNLRNLKIHPASAADSEQFHFLLRTR